MQQNPSGPLREFWSLSTEALLKQLQTEPKGLSGNEAGQRLNRVGANRLGKSKKTGSFSLFIGQFKSPITLILLFAAGLSFFLRDNTDALIILAIVFISGLLGFWQERGAAGAVAKLLQIVQVKATVLRDGQQQSIPVEEIVPGDIVMLSAGSVIPADGMILESNVLFVNEATLTGETFPVEKLASVLPAQTPLAQRSNALWMGTNVVSGSGKIVIVRTGAETEFGQISERLAIQPPETEFEHGVRHFGYLLMEVTLLLVIVIFFVNVYLARPVMDSFLFSLALAVGLTPQLLPAIISVNLAHGAKKMADDKVIVKRLAAIENFGSMNVLCCDKTGTLTEGKITLHSALDVDGKPSEKVKLYSFLNASFETGFLNPIDEAIRAQSGIDITAYKKLDEEPYDFIRKRLSILVAEGKTSLIITKGALPNVLGICTAVEKVDGTCVPLDEVRDSIQKQFEQFSSDGYRVLGVAYKAADGETKLDKSQETAMTFLGFLLLLDQPKADIAETIVQLKKLGIRLKIITGDNGLIAANVAKQIGMTAPKIITGKALLELSDAALKTQVREVDIFAEVEPNQKERIILALRKSGNVVGFMGDGINDTSALHAADVGISVDSAVDVAKEAADIVLLERNLAVLARGVCEGRKTFSNTLKYVFMATSANFGNMFSMAGASLFLSFLPLLPKQIMLTNLLTDFPEMTIATDDVDKELLERPRRWDIKFIRKFMFTFGLLSSIFDYMTFGVLLFVLHANQNQFRTGWFLESVISAALIVLVIRTRKSFFQSKPSRYLLIATLLTVAATLLLPYTPLASILGFEPLPLVFLLLLVGIIALYILAAELTKKVFYRVTGY
jgi:Mg2+-importing ATPase